MQYPNRIEFCVFGDYALFSDPITRVGGEKCSYPIPTYEALKGITASIYWKPTLIWYIDKVRIMNPIQMESKGIRTLAYSGGSDLSYYTYLKNCRYQVSAHFEWNMNRPELKGDRNEDKHYQIMKRMIERGGRRDIFLGTRECQAYVTPCVFGEGEGAYDNTPSLMFGTMYHGMTYADEAYSDETLNRMTLNFWRPEMQNGVISFLRPSDCPVHKPLHKTKIKPFGVKERNFKIEELKEV